MSRLLQALRAGWRNLCSPGWIGDDPNPEPGRLDLLDGRRVTITRTTTVTACAREDCAECAEPDPAPEALDLSEWVLAYTTETPNALVVTYRRKDPRP